MSVLSLVVCGLSQSSEKSAADWRRAAEAHLRAGEKRLAAEAFEQTVRLDPAARIQLAPMLVRLYAETRTSDKALGWAKLAMERSPDPRAYLAGVHAELGQFRQAQSILAEELAKSNAAPRTVALGWQLADLQLQQGETNAALATLERVARGVEGTPESDKARKRVQKLNGRSGR